VGLLTRGKRSFIMLAPSSRMIYAVITIVNEATFFKTFPP
jgi:hypothetical protein